MFNLSAHSSADLLTLLSEIDISVPPRGQGRKSYHCEQWSICRFLASYAEDELLDFPLQVLKRERPDVLLSIPGKDVGIEITEAIPPNWARVVERRVGREDAVLLHRCRPGEKLRPSDEIVGIAAGITWGSGWGGDAPEREWAEVMIYFAMQKARTLAKDGFERFDTDWLLIYDNWPLPAVNRVKAGLYFLERLVALSPPLPFARIFVESGSSIWQFQASDVSSAPIRDLWLPAESEHSA